MYKEYKEMNASVIIFKEPDYTCQNNGTNGFYRVLCIPGIIRIKRENDEDKYEEN